MAKYSRRKHNSSSRDAQDQRPHSLKYYLSSKKYHMNVGKFATKTFVQVKDFLVKEIPMPTILSTGGEAAELEYKNYGQPADIEEDDRSDNEPVPIKAAQKNSMEQIKQLTKRSNEVLCSAKTVWPFALFTDHVVLDRTKLTITKRDFFWSRQVMSIRIEDILNVSSDVGPFLGSINVVIRIMNSDDHINVSYLQRSDATHLKHIIQGYVIAQHNKIDVAHLTKDQLIETLTDLGHDLNK